MKLEDFDEFKKTDKPYARGEICVRTDSMASGYYNNPQETYASNTLQTKTKNKTKQKTITHSYSARSTSRTDGSIQVQRWIGEV